MSNNKNKKTIPISILHGIPATIIFLWISSAILINALEIKERGSFGDMFGAVNALFSGLALAGVVIAIILQSKELELQRRELEETKKEIKGQRLAQEGQNATLKAQMIENSVFNLLRSQEAIRESNNKRLLDVEVKGYRQILKELNIIFHIYSGTENSWINEQFAANPREIVSQFHMSDIAIETIKIKLKDNDLDLIKVSYRTLFAKYHWVLGHQFRHLYHLLKHIMLHESTAEAIAINSGRGSALESI